MPSTLNIPAPVRKSTQALNYFARLSASGAPRAEINKMKALKLLFFADRYHLRKYGRSVSDCAYFAMARGPVASEAKNVAEESNRLPSTSRTYARRYVRRKDAYNYSSVGEIDSAVLSKTDMEALDFAWQNFGHYTEFELVEITHKYPEWRRHASKLRHDGNKRVEMDYADFFNDPAQGYNPCHTLSSKDRKIALELFSDQQAFDQRWS
jgi:uncharacterized phage-associated protein